MSLIVATSSINDELATRKSGIVCNESDRLLDVVLLFSKKIASLKDSVLNVLKSARILENTA